MNEVQTELRRLPFWDRLSEEEQNRVRRASAIRVCEKGSVLRAMEGECLGFIAVIAGDLRAHMMSEEGREITLYHIRTGECDVLTASCIMYQITFETQVSVEEDSRILIIPTSVLSRLKEENIYVRSFIYELLTDRFSDVMWTIQQILFYGIDQRIAAFLTDAAEQRGTGVRSDVPKQTCPVKTSGVDGQGGETFPEIRVTHEQIAREINTAREVVARVVRRMAEDGLLQTGRGKIVITDPDGLRELAGELRR